MSAVWSYLTRAAFARAFRMCNANRREHTHTCMHTQKEKLHTVCWKKLFPQVAPSHAEQFGEDSDTFERCLLLCSRFFHWFISFGHTRDTRPSQYSQTIISDCLHFEIWSGPKDAKENPKVGSHEDSGLEMSAAVLLGLLFSICLPSSPLETFQSKSMDCSCC